MKSPFLKLLLISNFIISLLVSGALLLENQTVKKSRKAAENFQNTYLSSIRNSLDLGKSLNSYTDYMLKELRNPRGRDATIFVKRANSAAQLVLSSSNLEKGRANELKVAFEDLMKSGDSVMKRVDRGDHEVAREVFEKDYLDKLKAFNLVLDSHKKLIQNQASGFFTSRFLSGNEFKNGYSKLLFSLIGLSLFFWIGLFLYLGRIKRLRINKASRLKEERERLTDNVFELSEKIEEMRRLCSEALDVPIPGKKVLGLASTPKAPSCEAIQKELERAKRKIKEENIRIQEFQESFKSWHELNVKNAQRAEMGINNLRELKRMILNSFLNNPGFHNVQELLESIEEAQAFFDKTASAHDGLEFSNFEAQSLHALLKVEDSIKAYEMELADYGRLIEKDKEADRELFKRESEAFKQILIKRNESLAKALVLTDEEQKEPSSEKSLFEDLSKAS